MSGKRVRMWVQKQDIIELLAAKGDIDKAQLADAKLSKHIETEEARMLLERLGVDVDELHRRIAR
jgi:hypothetical protein